MTKLRYDLHRLRVIMLSRLVRPWDRVEATKPVNTSMAPRKRVAIPVRQLGLATGMVVRVRRPKARRVINVRYIP